MINLSKWAALGVVLVLMFALTNGVSQAQDAKIFEGTLLGVDANAKVLTLKAGDDKEMQFMYTDQTELVGPQNNGQPVAVRQGSKLKIYYTEKDKINVATKIEITEV